MTTEERKAYLNNLKDEAMQLIQAAFKNGNVATLGGDGRETIFFYLSLDEKSTWRNNIFYNSRYFVMSWDMENMKLKSLTDCLPIGFRKCNAKSPKEVAEKINKYLTS